jgi:hypothetical protein
MRATDHPMLGDVLLRKPITGIAVCCARAVNGTATAAPARRAKRSRRLISITVD